MSLILCDAYNVFTRSFCSYPAMDPRTGEHVGGVVGFVKTLTRAINDFKPERVYVVWEGGGSSRRRSLYSQYKANRKPGKLNRFYEDDLPDTDENKIAQVQKLIYVLKSLPVCQLYVSDVEADDVIAYMCTRRFRNEQKIIMSTDKDMYQLLDDQTRTYDLNKKCFITAETVKLTYNIFPRNFALAKTLCGDGSDNIPGVRGCGFKTVAKRFPLLLEDKDVLLQDVIDYASTRVDEAAVYRNTVSAADDLKTYWRLIYLDGSMLSGPAVSKLDGVIDKYVPALDKMELLKKCIAAGVGNHIDITSTSMSMQYLVGTGQINLTSDQPNTEGNSTNEQE